VQFALGKVGGHGFPHTPSPKRFRPAGEAGRIGTNGADCENSTAKEGLETYHVSCGYKTKIGTYTRFTNQKKMSKGVD
jgi:hypothetical protein